MQFTTPSQKDQLGVGHDGMNSLHYVHIPSYCRRYRDELELNNLNNYSEGFAQTLQSGT